MRLVTSLKFSKLLSLLVITVVVVVVVTPLQAKAQTAQDQRIEQEQLAREKWVLNHPQAAEQILPSQEEENNG